MKDFSTALVTLGFVVALAVGGVIGYKAAPMIDGATGTTQGEKEPICFAATLRQYQTGREITGWISAEWIERRSGWRVARVSTVQPFDQKVVPMAIAVDEGLTSPARFLRVSDAYGRFFGWFEIVSDQSGMGLGAPVGQRPVGQKPIGLPPQRGSVGKAQAPPDA